MRQILSKKFLKYFLISFLIFEAVLLLNFISRYIEDIFGKGISFSIILELFFYASITLIGFSFLFGILIASIFTFRYFSLNRTFSFKSNIASGLVTMIIVSILYFGFNNWGLPKANLEMTVMIYEFKNTGSDSEFNRVERDLFKNYHTAMTVKEINLFVDSINNRFDKYIQEADSLLSLLPDTTALEIYKRLNLDKYGINFNSSLTENLKKREVKRAYYDLLSHGKKMNVTIEKRQRYQKEKFNRIILPFELILLFLIGASFGFYYNDQKPFLLIILGLYTTSFFYGAILGFEKMIANNIFGNTVGTIYSVFVLVIITAIFIIKSLRKEKN